MFRQKVDYFIFVKYLVTRVLLSLFPQKLAFSAIWEEPHTRIWPEMATFGIQFETGYFHGFLVKNFDSLHWVQIQYIGYKCPKSGIKVVFLNLSRIL